jgi:LPS sulfotransferase NodH
MDGEVYAAISPDWFEQSGVDPTGLNLQQLQADLSAIR